MSSVLVYDPSGALQETIPTDRRLAGLCRAGEKLVGMSFGPPEVEVLNGPRRVMSIDLSQPTRRPMMACLPDGRVALVERTAGVVHVVDPALGSVSSFTPDMSRWANRKSGPLGSPVIFSSVAASSDGKLLVTLGHYRLPDGAPVLGFDANGRLTDTWRCYLPAFESQKNPQNPEGYMAPSKVAVNGSLLVLASISGKIAYYSR